ncbi:MAG: HlyD family efflux transporter periplasmic adaptor subunit [Sediminibacterium sp.]|nr:HlyD family efflux transporter periplasmic adaptor subunit [Sediminibacterium sp.]
MPEYLNTADVHSEEVQDIIGRAPSWIIRRGSYVVAFVIVLLVIGAWTIRYPDIISAPVMISAATPPVKIIARASGRIIEFSAKDGTTVKENQIIAVVDNSANTKDMLTLKDIVESIDTTLDIQKIITQIPITKTMQVGDVQSDYASLFQSISNYRFFAANQYYADKRQVIGKQQKDNDKIKEGIRKREELLDEQLKIDGRRDSVNQALVKEKVIAPLEYAEMKKAYLSQKMSTADNMNSLLQIQQQHSEYQKSLADLEQQYNTEKKDIFAAIRDAAKRIKGHIAIWEQQYVIKSPIEGDLVFFKVWKENQYVNTGEQIFLVVPTTQQFEVRARLPIFKSGKIKVGQKILIKLHEYPYEEFGMLRGEVQALTNVSLDSAYVVQLKLYNGLHTTRNKTINFRPEITGNVDIVTNDKNILQRIFESIYAKVNDR